MSGSLRCCSLCFSSAVFFAIFLFGTGMGFASAEPARELADYEGDWRQIDPDLDHASRFHAIDEALSDLSWVLRTMAVPVLRETTAPPPRMQFVWDGEHLEQRLIESKGSRVRTVELGRASLDGRDTQDAPVAASWDWTDEGLQLSWEQHQAHGHTIYRVDAESGMLIVEHTIQVTAISDVAPIVFESRFGRQTPPVVASDRDAGRFIAPLSGSSTGH